MKGICRVCGEHKKLTFEHIPPESAFNSTPVFIQKHYHLHDKDSHLFGKRHLSNRGGGDYYSCVDCNTKTGSWYADSYKKFAYLGMIAIKHRVFSSNKISFDYLIQPLNILKQILYMFMCIDSSDMLLKSKGLKHFILDKESNDMPQELRVFLYHTYSISLRNGWSFIRNETGYHSTGELTFRPLGLVYTLDSEPIRNDYLDITSFKNFKFNEIVKMNLSMPFFTPKGYVPGMYTDTF